MKNFIEITTKNRGKMLIRASAVQEVYTTPENEYNDPGTTTIVVAYLGQVYVIRAKESYEIIKCMLEEVEEQ